MAGHSSVSQSAPAHTHIPITTLWNSEWVRKRHREKDGVRESKSVRKISCHTETFTSASVYGHYILYLWLKWGVHYQSIEGVWVCACVWAFARACMTKKPSAQMFVSAWLCTCVGALFHKKGDETWYKLTLGSARCRFAQLSTSPGSHRVMWNFLSNRKHLNVGWRIMELPVETYWGRSNTGVNTPRLSMSRSSLIRPFKYF